MSTAPKPSAVHLPRSALSTLSHRCASLGDPGVQALREAGYRAGAEVLAALGESPAELPSHEFWSRLDTAFRRAGLGSVSFHPVSREAGAVAWLGSVEAASSDSTGEHCHFALGLLGGVLSRAADRTMDVAEVRCAGGGARPCWFVFGSVDTLVGLRKRRSGLESPGRRPPEPVGP